MMFVILKLSCFLPRQMKLYKMVYGSNKYTFQNGLGMVSRYGMKNWSYSDILLRMVYMHRCQFVMDSSMSGCFVQYVDEHIAESNVLMRDIKGD